MESKQDIASCWSGKLEGCRYLREGTWNGRKVTNYSNGGSSFAEHYLLKNKNEMYLSMRDCGPYVGACEYSWIGRFNESTNMFEGDISYYPATYGHMKVKWLR